MTTRHCLFGFVYLVKCGSAVCFLCVTTVQYCQCPGRHQRSRRPPCYYPRGKRMMPPADRIYDAGQGAKKDLTDTGDDFLAIGPALRIMQLNVEGLSAAKREVISSIAERQKIDVICLEETRVDADKTNHFSTAGFDLLAYSLHAKYGQATYVQDQHF